MSAVDARSSGVRTPGFTRVVATPEEVAAYRERHGHRPAVERSQCDHCGTRIWHSGLGVASHRRAHVRGTR